MLTDILNSNGIYLCASGSWTRTTDADTYAELVAAYTFVEGGTVNAMTFGGGGDTQYKVEVAVNSESDIIYSGWLSLSDLGQTFQPDPNVLQPDAYLVRSFLPSKRGDNSPPSNCGGRLVMRIGWPIKIESSASRSPLSISGF